MRSPAIAALISLVAAAGDLGASQVSGQAGPPKVSALPVLEEPAVRTLPIGTEVDFVLQTLLAAGSAKADERFEATLVTAKIPPESMRPVAMARATGFLSSVRRPGPGRSALTLSFDELDFESKTQRLRGSVIQVFQSVRPDQSDPKMPATQPYRGLTPLAGVMVDIPGTVTSIDGKEVRLPPGTILRVRLEQPITIRVPSL